VITRHRDIFVKYLAIHFDVNPRKLVLQSNSAQANFFAMRISDADGLPLGPRIYANCNDRFGSHRTENDHSSRGSASSAFKVVSGRAKNPTPRSRSRFASDQS
jgi:hypothetical protein